MSNFGCFGERRHIVVGFDPMDRGKNQELVELR